MYGSSKASLMFATRIMSKEFSNYNIRVNAVAPSVTATEMLDKMDKKAMEKMLKMSNLSEPLSTSEVADEVLFLASEKSLQVNGQIIRLEGNKIDK
jgi:3-oxoacyl-[acyl-carrier protein] reductase